MRAQWTTEAIQAAIIEDPGKPKEKKYIYDREWVKAALEDFRVVQAKKEKCTKNLIFNKNELKWLAYQAPRTKKAMEALSPNVRPITVIQYYEQILDIINNGFKEA